MMTAQLAPSSLPSGGVLGDGEGDCDGVLCGGEGGILDCFFTTSSEDFGTNCRDLLVIFSLLCPSM
jgi:hypothetical protein